MSSGCWLGIATPGKYPVAIMRTTSTWYFLLLSYTFPTHSYSETCPHLCGLCWSYCNACSARDFIIIMLHIIGMSHAPDTHVVVIRPIGLHLLLLTTLVCALLQYAIIANNSRVFTMILLTAFEALHKYSTSTHCAKCACTKQGVTLDPPLISLILWLILYYLLFPEILTLSSILPHSTLYLHHSVGCSYMVRTML